MIPSMWEKETFLPSANEKVADMQSRFISKTNKVYVTSVRMMFNGGLRWVLTNKFDPKFTDKEKNNETI